ncbi:MAG: hypothetical protein MI700_03585 [Balneolales bacterium]|nr:hypothetical protein [Balneolales bacterium]
MKYSTVGYLIVISTLFLVFCTSPPQQSIPYTLVPYSGDIRVEQFDSTITDVNRFNYNNQVFKVGNQFRYSYEYISTEGDTLAFQFTEGEEWEFVPSGAPERITGISISVNDGLSPFDQWYPDYNQTVISYTYEPQESYNATGAIENEANVWIHPPRQGLMKILELNPFPYVEYPLEILNDWSWSVQIGNSWADERWATWDSTLTNTATYQLLSRETKETRFGELVVYTINAEAVNEIGSSEAEFEFSEPYGFLEMRFINIDGSRLTLTLDEVNF